MYYVILGVCAVGLLIRTTYELLKRTGRVDPRNPTVFRTVFTAMGFLLGSWIFLGAFDPLPLSIPWPWNLIGLVLAGAAAALVLLGVIRLKGLENIQELHTEGIYSTLRHPMYMGFILWILGWVLFHRAGASMILAAVCILDILLWRKFEEDALVEKFGDAYREYRKRTLF